MVSLRKIDQLTQGDHHNITEKDNCYYFAEYPSHNSNVNFDNPIFSLISNLKKTVDRRGLPQWKYKLEAIRKCTSYLSDFFTRKGNIAQYTLVPIPPSKTKENQLYDDRMTQILKGLESSFPECQVRELIYSLKDRKPAHHSQNRPSINDLYDNFAIDESQFEGIRNNIILFDDVITNGAHFQAAKKRILEHKPEASIRGIFIARRVFPEEEFPFDINDLF